MRRKCKLRLNTDIVSKYAGRFTENVFDLRTFFAHLCYSKSVTWFLHEWITECGRFLKCKYKCKYNRLFLLNIFMYVA